MVQMQENLWCLKDKIESGKFYEKTVVTGCSGYIGGTFCYEALKND